MYYSAIMKEKDFICNRTLTFKDFYPQSHWVYARMYEYASRDKIMTLYPKMRMNTVFNGVFALRIILTENASLSNTKVKMPAKNK